MIRRLIILLLIVGCAPKPIYNRDPLYAPPVTREMFEIAYKYHIQEDCKKECVTFIISSDEWCECMDSCLNTKDNMKIKIADCEPDSIKSN